ncbi:MAG: peptidoglycan DD-metalloendopeptidase family protein [Rhizobiales bacterium]|nr:peptidoglycan DD-metalloendopeptidase family protein [Hyphomicrobiales bacterium]
MILNFSCTRFEPGWTMTLVIGLALSVGTAAAFADPRPQYVRMAQADPKNPADALNARDRELDAVRVEQKKAAAAEQKLKREIDDLGADRRRLNLALVETAIRVRKIEGDLSATEARLKPLEEKERMARQSFEAKRADIAEVLAALQRMGRRPPPALLARPEDALQSVRSAILLGAVLPDMRLKTATLAAELAEFVRLRDDIAGEKAKLARDLATLSEDTRRMTLLVEHRQKRQVETEKAMEAERQNAFALARQAENLKDLIATLEKGLDSANRAARAAARAAESAKPSSGRPNLAALNDPGRLVPAVAFASAKGLLPLPVTGIKIRDFGTADGLGGTEKGIGLATRAGAQVTAPCDGWVVYAGPFRSYGQLLILNAGGGYYVLLAGMERISVDLGQFVLTGEPVAVMGGGSKTAATVSIGSSQPALYVEFRKDGAPVDPSPWWATSEGEKVRG